MTRQIIIAKPDNSKSCIHCRRSGPPGSVMRCNHYEKLVMPEDAQTCDKYKDSRTTYQVISASGKAFA